MEQSGLLNNLKKDTMDVQGDRTERVEPSVYAEPRQGKGLWISGILFILTLGTTSIMGVLHTAAFERQAWIDEASGFLSIIGYLIHHPSLWLMGLPYTGALMLILLSHEMGHFLYCRYYRVDATPPMLLPAPIPPFGTFGAFIRIKSPIPHRNSLFDIGVAGPLAGFIVAVPFLIYGIAHSRPLALTGHEGEYLIFGEPLIWKLLSHWIWPNLGSMDLEIHPVAFAAWFGMLATNLNLFPIGQLDGGHVSFALFGARARLIGILCWLGLMGLVIHNYVWTLWTLLTFIIGFRHPPTIYTEPQPRALRRFVGLLALLVFILTFTPDPIQIPPR